MCSSIRSPALCTSSPRMSTTPLWGAWVISRQRTSQRTLWRWRVASTTLLCKGNPVSCTKCSSWHVPQTPQCMQPRVLMWGKHVAENQRARQPKVRMGRAKKAREARLARPAKSRMRERLERQTRWFQPERVPTVPRKPAPRRQARDGWENFTSWTSDLLRVPVWLRMLGVRLTLPLVQMTSHATMDLGGSHRSILRPTMCTPQHTGTTKHWAKSMLGQQENWQQPLSGSLGTWMICVESSEPPGEPTPKCRAQMLMCAQTCRSTAKLLDYKCVFEHAWNQSKWW